MARYKVAAIFLAFFGLLSANTFYRFDVPSRPLHVLQNIVDLLLTSWMGNSIAAAALAMIGVLATALVLGRSYESNAELVLDSTKAALRGKVHRPTVRADAGRTHFGKR